MLHPTTNRPDEVYKPASVRGLEIDGVGWYEHARPLITPPEPGENDLQAYYRRLGNATRLLGTISVIAYPHNPLTTEARLSVQIGVAHVPGQETQRIHLTAKQSHKSPQERRTQRRIMQHYLSIGPLSCDPDFRPTRDKDRKGNKIFGYLPDVEFGPQEPRAPVTRLTGMQVGVSTELLWRGSAAVRTEQQLGVLIDPETVLVLDQHPSVIGVDDQRFATIVDLLSVAEHTIYADIDDAVHGF